jgi:cell division protein ZapA
VSAQESRAVITVTIAGEEYVIRTDATPEYTRDCADYLDRTIAGIQEKSKIIEAHKTAILAGLALTDQLFQARAETEALHREIARLADRLSADIERRLAAPDLASQG